MSNINSTSDSELSNIMDMLDQINNKLNDVIPRVINIEERLHQFDCLNSLSDIKSSTSDILAEVRGCAQSVGSFPGIRRDSEVSDSLSQASDTSVSPGSFGTGVLEEAQPVLHGLVMSDSNMTELATKTGQLLNCDVDMFNYRQSQLEESIFDKKLEFVLIQDSGQLLEQYGELTNTTVQDMTAHVQHIVNLSSNILELQPDTKVLLGSLPPRYDSRVGAELVRLFNNLLLTESIMEDRISVVTQSQLSCRFEKKKVERFESDLVTLTRYGMKLRDKNIATQIAQAISHVKVSKKNQNHHHLHQQQHGPVWVGDKQNLKARIAEFLHSL